MKTIFQSQDIPFHTLNFKDAVVLLPLMDELVKLINKNRIADFYNNLPNEEKEKYHRIWRGTEINLSAESAEKILNLLNDLGFESQIDLKDANLDDLTRK
jgi:hypothetical protein